MGRAYTRDEPRLLCRWKLVTLACEGDPSSTIFNAIRQA